MSPVLLAQSQKPLLALLVGFAVAHAARQLLLLGLLQLTLHELLLALFPLAPLLLAALPLALALLTLRLLELIILLIVLFALFLLALLLLALTLLTLLLCALPALVPSDVPGKQRNPDGHFGDSLAQCDDLLRRPRRY